MTVSELRKKSNAFVRDLDLNILLAVEAVEEEIVDLNRGQMLSSTRSDGQAITPEYSPAYAARKGFSAPNLKLTGDFQSEMDLIVEGNEYIITSFDFKTPFLVDKYGAAIFGITVANQAKAQNLTARSLTRLYRRKVL